MTATRRRFSVLGELALDPEVRIGGDSGQPIAIRGGADAHSAAFFELAKTVEERCGQAQSAAPRVTVED